MTGGAEEESFKRTRKKIPNSRQREPTFTLVVAAFTKLGHFSPAKIEIPKQACKK
jgi:hypothetical protein